MGLVGLSNVLKWMLRAHRDAMLGLLLGILLGSVFGIWPFDASTSLVEGTVGASLAIAGFALTILISRIRS